MIIEEEMRNKICPLTNIYIKCKKQLINKYACIYFNKKGLQHNILPKYTKIYIKENHRLKKHTKMTQLVLIKNDTSPV